MKNFVVYKSSAGSGKTTTLAIEYLKISLAKPADFKHILALTFTKDAANEMKQRILEYLIQMINFEEEEALNFIFDPIIQSQADLKARYSKGERTYCIQKVQEQASQLLQLILHNYSDFAISTIDSFTHRIIKSFAHDLGIAISFDVELDTDNLLKMAVNELISRIGEDNPKLTEILLDFSMHKIGSDKSRKIDEDLRSLSANLLDDVKEEFLVDIRKLSIDELLKIKEQIFKELKNFKDFVHQEARAAREVILEKGLDCTKFFHGSGNICNWFFKLSEKNFADKDLKPKTRVWSSIQDDKWGAGKTEAADLVKIESIQDILKQHFHKLNDFIEEHFDNYLIFKEISKQIYPLVVLNEIEKLIFQLKAESNVLHISDFNKLIANAIAGEPAPFIYERIGNWYTYFLIDEFQDTSALQWNNLLPLVENSLSENNLSLLVGDGKQSVYRWRGSDVKQFVSLPELLNKPDELSRQREYLLKENYLEKPLAVNYRSDEKIVEFNNDLFHFIRQSNWLSESYKKVYDEVEQSFAESKKDFGLVDVYLAEESDTETQQKAVLDQVLLAHSEGYSYRDISILVRKNKEATAYADLLIAHDIPVLSSVGLRVSSSSKVNFLLSLLRIIAEPKEIVYQAEALRFILQEQLVASYSLKNYHQLISEFMSHEKGFQKAFYSFLEENDYHLDVRNLNQSDVYELVEYLIRTFKLRVPDPYLQFFLDILQEFKQQAYTQLSDFLIWWPEHEEKFFIEMPNGLDAVMIQTVFKAKGLQYPVVIYPIFDRSIKTPTEKNKKWLKPEIEELDALNAFPLSITSLKDTRLSEVYEADLDNQKLDNINLFYVALTRAKHRLFILIDRAKEKKKKSANAKPYAHFLPSAMFEEYLSTKKEQEVEANRYRFGTQARLPEAVETIDSDFYYLDEFKGADWRNHLHLTNSRILDSVNTEASHLLWGIYVHEVMANIHDKQDVEKALEKAMYSGLIQESELEKIGFYIEQIISHPQLSGFYEEGVKSANEADMIDSFGFFHRPDRLVFFDDKTIVIDYKTGKQNEKHQKQVRNYASLLAQLDFPNPEAYLIYLHDQIEVVKV
jgi:ATP-dependent exoDNAse (exonuclease V) beta subunit